jgi:hypothetical protein
MFTCYAQYRMETSTWHLCTYACTFPIGRHVFVTCATHILVPWTLFEEGNISCVHQLNKSCSFKDGNHVMTMMLADVSYPVSPFAANSTELVRTSFLTSERELGQCFFM